MKSERFERRANWAAILPMVGAVALGGCAQHMETPHTPESFISHESSTSTHELLMLVCDIDGRNKGLLVTIPEAEFAADEYSKNLLDCKPDPSPSQSS